MLSDQHVPALDVRPQTTQHGKEKGLLRPGSLVPAHVRSQGHPCLGTCVCVCVRAMTVLIVTHGLWPWAGEPAAAGEAGALAWAGRAQTTCLPCLTRGSLWFRGALAHLASPWLPQLLGLWTQMGWIPGAPAPPPHSPSPGLRPQQTPGRFLGCTGPSPCHPRPLWRLPERQSGEGPSSANSSWSCGTRSPGWG